MLNVIFYEKNIGDNEAVSAIPTYRCLSSTLVNGKAMYYNSSIDEFENDLSSLVTGDRMFESCDDLYVWEMELPLLAEGRSMFKGTSISSFNIELPALVYGSSMFANTPIVEWSIDMPSIIDAEEMFAGSSLVSFAGKMNTLENGTNMFIDSELESCDTDLSSLVTGVGMFKNCVNLYSYSGDLSSLTEGDEMFCACKLSPESVLYIADSIQYVPGGVMSIGIDIATDATIEDLNEFASFIHFDSWADLKQAFIDKGWEITWQYGGTTTVITL